MIVVLSLGVSENLDLSKIYLSKNHFFSDICATLFVRSVSFFTASICFVLLEVTFLFNSFSLSSESVFSTKSFIPALVANFTCANLTAKFSRVNLLNS